MRALQELGAEVRFSERKRGYDQTEVDEFVASVRRTAAEAQAHISELRKRLGAAESQGESGSHEIRETLLRTLVLAQRTADTAVAEARTEAESIADSARERASKTVAEAEAAADERLRSSEERAAALLAEGEEQSQAIIAEGKRVAAAELAAERARATEELAAMQDTKEQLETNLAELAARMDAERETLSTTSAALQQLVEQFAPVASEDSDEPVPLDAFADAGFARETAISEGTQSHSQPREAGRSRAGRADSEPVEQPEPAAQPRLEAVPVDAQPQVDAQPPPEARPRSGEADQQAPAAGFLPDTDDAVIGATGTENTAALEIVPVAGDRSAGRGPAPAVGLR